MKFLVISDIHGNLDALDVLAPRFKEADAVLCGGDFARFQHPETGLPVLERLCRLHDTVFAVAGNCDAPDFLEELERRDMSVQGALTGYEGLVVAGCGGGTRFTGATPNERDEEDILADLSIITGQGEQRWDNLIAIMHNPPQGTDCDCAGGAHVGSPLLRSFIEAYAPLLVVTGHIHEGVGIDAVGTTTVVNPGALLEGRYAWVEVEPDGAGWKVSRAELCSVARGEAQ